MAYLGTVRLKMTLDGGAFVASADCGQGSQATEKERFFLELPEYFPFARNFGRNSHSSAWDLVTFVSSKC